jgi:hypothetical protein
MEDDELFDAPHAQIGGLVRAQALEAPCTQQLKNAELARRMNAGRLQDLKATGDRIGKLAAAKVQQFVAELNMKGTVIVLVGLRVHKAS